MHFRSPTLWRFFTCRVVTFIETCRQIQSTFPDQELGNLVDSSLWVRYFDWTHIRIGHSNIHRPSSKKWDLVTSSLDCSIWRSFCLFYTVDCINKACSFLLWRHSCSKKVPVEKESSLSRGGAITFLALFHQNHINLQQHTMSPSCDGYSHSKRYIFPMPGNNKCIMNGERVDFLSHFFLLQ